jgi:small ubiquitin-related modifier
MSGSDENGSPGAPEKPEGATVSEHLNIKVTDNNNEVFFKIKRTTALKKLMDAFCERQGKAPNSVRFLFDGSRVQATDSPDTVRYILFELFTFLYEIFAVPLSRY